MKQITFFLDFISPYSYLAFEHLPQALQGLSYSIEYRPVLFAGLLKQHGQLGPAEIAPKRDWTYRQVLWQAHRHSIPMQMPAQHPFNPLPLLRHGAEAQRDAVLAKARQQLAAGRTPEQVLEFLAHTLTNKLLHAPSANLRAAAQRGDVDLLRAAERLFDSGAAKGTAENDA